MDGAHLQVVYFYPCDLLLTGELLELFGAVTFVSPVTQNKGKQPKNERKINTGLQASLALKDHFSVLTYSVVLIKTFFHL